MFTVEIRVNGTLINHIYGRNVRDITPGVSDYHYECYTAESGKVVCGSVHHARKDGINKLVSLILAGSEAHEPTPQSARSPRAAQGNRRA